MFPYIDTTPWPFAPFFALVAIGLAAGFAIAAKRARRSGIDPEHFAKLAVCVIVAAFLGGHIAKFAYVQEGWATLSHQPWRLLQVFNGLASFGALLGGFVAAQIFLWRHRVPYRNWYLYADAAAFAAPFGWSIGRLGCYLEHDHPGVRTTSFLGVRYPGGARFDLGLLEMLFLLLLAAAFLLLDRIRTPRGFYYVAFLFAYGIFRLVLDGLHVEAVRYGIWTVDHIAASILIAGGVLTALDLIRLQM
ncbi:MAG TPA: prolipoprotein diacylglyceryl transferase family protein [Bryobacteraceae bacterium]|jgi:phosphatidylglycerol:prolipoprotein diacylglycerol transferase|nr:prolipoprotein diacylglyceryl transferase family protein [Bryobacteraceae bacterium]